MAIVKRNNPVFPALSNWFDDFFADDLDLLNKVATVPSVNIKERKKDYLIELAVPGLNKEDIDIDIENNVMTISSQKKEEKEENDGTYTKREFYYNEFKRVFTLPETADAEKIDAEYKNGVLKIKIDKKPEAQQKPAKKIKIK
jgi:HSP20 family protein